MKHGLKVLIYKSGTMQIAQCIEYDLSVQARSEKEALSRLHYIFKSYRAIGKEKDRDLLTELREAPKIFSDKFEQGFHIRTETWSDCEFEEVSLRTQKPTIIKKAA